MKFCNVVCLAIILAVSALGVSAEPNVYHEVKVEALEAQLFPILLALDHSTTAQEALTSNPTFKQWLTDRSVAIDKAPTQCDTDGSCLNAAFRFDSASRSALLDGLGAAYRSDAQLRALADTLVCKSNDYPMYRKLGCEHAFVQAVDDELTGVDNAIEIFGEGKPSTRGAVDQPEYDVQSLGYRQTLNTLAHNVLEAIHPSTTIFRAQLLYACYLLIANRSDYMTKYPNLDSADNANAVSVLHNTDWAKYKYSAILIPGLGPEIAGVQLAAGGRARLRIAVKRYLAGEAPVIVVSGGTVHPAHTEFDEAVEMKRALVEDFGIPSDAVIIEPFARRTTTNIRNTARLLVRYGVGLDKPILVTTDIYQSLSITNGQIADRCLKTLGYVPYRVLEQISSMDTSLQLTPESLQFDPRDPLDP